MRRNRIDRLLIAMAAAGLLLAIFVVAGMGVVAICLVGLEALRSVSLCGKVIIAAAVSWVLLTVYAYWDMRNE